MVLLQQILHLSIVTKIKVSDSFKDQIQQLVWRNSVNLGPFLFHYCQQIDILVKAHCIPGLEIYTKKNPMNNLQTNKIYYLLLLNNLSTWKNEKEKMAYNLSNILWNWLRTKMLIWDHLSKNMEILQHFYIQTWLWECSFNQVKLKVSRKCLFCSIHCNWSRDEWIEKDCQIRAIL